MVCMVEIIIKWYFGHGDKRTNKQLGEPRASLLVEQWAKQTFAITGMERNNDHTKVHILPSRWVIPNPVGMVNGHIYSRGKIENSQNSHKGHYHKKRVILWIASQNPAEKRVKLASSRCPWKGYLGSWREVSFCSRTGGAPLKPGLCSSYLSPLVSDQLADIQCIKQLCDQTNLWVCPRLGLPMQTYKPS